MMIDSLGLSDAEEAAFRLGGLELRIVAHALYYSVRGQRMFTVEVMRRCYDGAWIPLRRVRHEFTEDQIVDLHKVYSIPYQLIGTPPQ